MRWTFQRTFPVTSRLRVHCPSLRRATVTQRMEATSSLCRLMLTVTYTKALMVMSPCVPLAVNLTTCVVSTCHYDRCIILLCCDVIQQEYVTVKWAVMLIQMLMEWWVVVWALSLLDVTASTGVNPERDRQISLMVILHFKFIPKIHMIWFTFKLILCHLLIHMWLQSGLFFSPVDLINQFMGCFCLCF